MSELGIPDTKRRGGGFPSLPLRDAVDAVVVAGLNGRDHSVEAFATYLGHATANSGAFRSKLASLRDWGLIARGDKDRVALSGLGEELVLAHPDHHEAHDVLLKAFESCRMFGMVYADSAKNFPIELAKLRTQVLMKHGVANNQAVKFIDSFVQSAVFAGLARTEGSTVTLLTRSLDRAGPAQAEVPVKEDEEAGVPVPATEAAPPPPSFTPIALRQQWPIRGGEIEFVIRTPEALPASIYVHIAEMVLLAEKISVGLSEASPNSDPDPRASSVTPVVKD